MFAFTHQYLSPHPLLSAASQPPPSCSTLCKHHSLRCVLLNQLRTALPPNPSLLFLHTIGAETRETLQQRICKGTCRCAGQLRSPTQPPCHPGSRTGSPSPQMSRTLRLPSGCWLGSRSFPPPDVLLTYIHISYRLCSLHLYLCSLFFSRVALTVFLSFLSCLVMFFCFHTCLSFFFVPSFLRCCPLLLLLCLSSIFINKLPLLKRPTQPSFHFFGKAEIAFLVTGTPVKRRTNVHPTARFSVAQTPTSILVHTHSLSVLARFWF